jgi:putative transposase
MPRLLRSDLPDGVFHVTARGVGGIAIFRDDDDRRSFLALLARTVARHDWTCHAFCLMGTHYHLVLQTTRTDLSTGFQWLNGSYAQAFNRRHKRWGHLFGARFAAWLVETDEHLAAACRYVVSNPVRAGLVERAEDWRWSGIRPRRTYVRQLD